MNSISLARYRVGSIIGSALTLRSGGFIFCVIIILSLNLVDEKANQLLNIIIISSLVVEVFNTYESYFYVKRKSEVIVLANLISGSIGLVLKIIVVHNFIFLWTLALPYLVESIIKSAILYFYGRRIKLELKRDYLQETIPKLSFVFLSGASMVIIFKIDQVMINYFLPKSDLAIYSVAVRITEVWIFICIAISNFQFESILKSLESSVELFDQKIIQLYKKVICISLAIIIGVFILSSTFVELFFGDKFIESIQILNIYILSLPFLFLNNASWKYFIPLKLEKFATIKLFIGALINIVLNLLLIPKFGLIGAAISTVIAMVFISVYGNLLFKKTRNNYQLIKKSVKNLPHVKKE